MSSNFNNRKKLFSEVVGLELWHESFSEEKISVNLYADVVFSEGRLGGESGSKVRFQLKIKRAEFFIIIPEFEPIKVDRNSVSRDSIDSLITRTSTFTSDKEASISGGLHVDVALDSTSFGANMSTQGSAILKSGEKYQSLQELAKVSVKQSMIADGQYRWELRPTVDSFLDGRPWDATERPRLRLIDKRGDSKSSIIPAVRAEVGCKREDLDISNVEIKDEKIW